MSIIRVTAILSIPKKTILRRVGASNTEMWETEAVIDTGCTRGIVIPQSVATKMGLLTTEENDLPVILTHETVPGKATNLRVEIPSARVSAVVRAFVTEQEDHDILIGAEFFAAVGAVLVMGKQRFSFTRKNPEDEEDQITAFWRYSDDD